MFDWNHPVPNSPPKKHSSSSAASSLLWKSQYSEPHGNIWNSCSSLQPSKSIWGSQIKSSVTPQTMQCGSFMQPAFAPSSTANQTSSTFGPAIGHQRQRRMSSIPSLSGSVSSVSSSLWFEDPYLVSPPPSPETLAAVGSTTPPPSAALSPIRSPTSLVLASSSQEEFVISATSGPLYFVQFKGDRVDVFTAPGTAVYKVGEAVMVDADRGRDLGTVIAVNVSRHDAAALKQRQNQDRQTALHSSGCNANASNNNNNSCSNNSSSSSDGTTSPGPTIYSPKQILGSATASEISDMAAKTNDESAAVALCNKRALERHLDIKIVDAEYQWDRRKLTFFYTAETRVDFRDLVRELFRVYKTRIWMCATTSRFQ